MSHPGFCEAIQNDKNRYISLDEMYRFCILSHYSGTGYNNPSHTETESIPKKAKSSGGNSGDNGGNGNSGSGNSSGTGKNNSTGQNTCTNTNTGKNTN